MSDSTKQVPKKETKKPVKRTRSRNPLPTKVVIRHLPPTLTSGQFKEQISPISDHNYFYYVRGDPLLGEFSFSRAYINFINQEDILRFREKFDNFVFVDDKGNEYTAIVELALYQGAPKRRKKVDAKCKTIESDPDFLQFVENKENLNKPDVLPSVEECLEEIETKEKASKHDTKITPLLQYINAEHRKITEIKKKSVRDESKEKRRKEERVRKRKEKERDRKKPREALSGSKQSASSKNGKELTEVSANSIPIKSKDSRAEHKEDGGATKEPRKREKHRRKNDEKKTSKPIDDRAAENKPGEKSRFEGGSAFKRPKSAASNTGKKEEPQTFTVRILKNESRSEPKPSNSSNVTNVTAKPSSVSKEAKGEAKTGESGAKERRVPDKIRNKDRPTIQIYRPTPRSSTSQSKEQKETAKKPSQERSAKGS